ncbi:FlgB family protein [Roseovarius sp. SYSU LYC5161]|uniref:FlgB family protein n=1 Tax=Roseovarius halophilus (ex Wu et al. 2025) TaxID=3376060 RepID=UPI00287162E6|nr:FlgB family protein [Roseovarius sp.]
MFQNLDIFKTAHAMASHAGARQTLVAQNMANADTPGYAAQDLPAFAEIHRQGPQGFRPVVTRAGHMLAPQGNSGLPPARERHDAVADPNGNSVSLETEMLKAVDVKRQHDRAIAIYRSSLTVLRTALGRQ